MARRVPTPLLQSCTAVVMATLVSACNGTIGDTGKGIAGETGVGAGNGTPTCTAPCDPSDPTTRTPGALRIWRLTNQQYDNTVRDLLGDDTAPAEAFIRDIGGAGFANNAALLGVSDAQAAAYRTAATKLASDAVAKRLDSSSRAERPRSTTQRARSSSCSRSARERFADRSPARDASLLRLLHRNQGITRCQDSDLDGHRNATSVTPFLFRTELAMRTQLRGDIVRLGAYETASALSYYLWDTMPDGPLLEAADRTRSRTQPT